MGMSDLSDGRIKKGKGKTPYSIDRAYAGAHLPLQGLVENH